MGKVWLVGAGPGAPDLITLRGARLLAQADVVLYDALANPELLALAPQARKIAVGKRCGKQSTAQAFINRSLVNSARRNHTVVRLKCGDPMLFGRAQEEIDALNEAGIEFEVVPGITAALAASADLGVPLTVRGVSRSVTFVTPRVGASEIGSDWAQAVLGTDTAVLYMAAGQAGRIALELIARGKPVGLPAVVVENASMPDRRIWTLTLGELPQFAATQLSGPAVILLGEAFRRISAAETLEAASRINAIACAG
ncbi:MAG TPA: uroporphyrinogen-III C-methyltransferase [Burkholderiales bacterium]|nr:uroporphyrinogen-III C-methyltransferase [Burkholderiales bacterium]